MAEAVPKELSAKALQQRRDLAEELVAIHRKHKVVFARVDEIKAALKEMASDAGSNFRELFEGKGVVKVSAGHEGKLKGAFPTVDERAFYALPDKEREGLEEAGIVKVVPTWGNPYYGSITVEIF
jgi:hypothetical protein